MECVSFTLIIDDIVLPDGRTVMEQLGGGGPQSLFGYQLVRPLVAGVQGEPCLVGLSAGVGTDLPPCIKAWLSGILCDTDGLVVVPGRSTPRAWQVFEADGRRTQVWRGKGDPCDELYAMLRPSLDAVPERYRHATNYHLGIHPLHPPKRLLAALRAAAHAKGGRLSIEPYTAAEEPATLEQVVDLLSACDVFSPNEAEAATLVGAGSPGDLAERLLALSPPGGADTVVVRCGPEGVVVRSRAGRGHGETELRIPAVADTQVVDVTGCGNAFCGGFLAALHHLTTAAAAAYGNDGGDDGDGSGSVLARAGAWGCVAASIMAEAQGVPQDPIPMLQVKAAERFEELLPRVQPLRMHAVLSTPSSTSSSSFALHALPFGASAFGGAASAGCTTTSTAITLSSASPLRVDHQRCSALYGRCGFGSWRMRFVGQQQQQQRRVAARAASSATAGQLRVQANGAARRPVAAAAVAVPVSGAAAAVSRRCRVLVP